ncbi:MAG TPA: protein kinase [Anaeromyxobacteraceae bacterium]|nr:protein kinase [Anaeromyxobacteraceae bacterium]
MSELIGEMLRAPGQRSRSDRGLGLPPGTMVGRFEILAEIGRGGFGVVYEARDTQLDRLVALKLLAPGSLDAGIHEGVLREAEAAATLSHPNIVTLHDVGQSEYGPYLVFELLRGRTLAERLRDGPLPLPEALKVAAEVATGLAHAHARGVVHRDLKPENIFLARDGWVKILDLGMAQAFGRRRREGGTPKYMAPEQRRGAPEDERTDVYALGVITFVMLTGEFPFRDASPPAGAAAPQLNVPGAPALGVLVGRMLDPDPVRRPRDAGEVAEALKTQLEVLAGNSVPESGVRIRRRRPSVRAAAIFTVAGLVIAGSVGVWLRDGRRRLPWLERAPAAHSIAVLPFADLSPNRDQEYFSDGLADEILGALGSVQGLHVPSRTSSFFFKGKGVKLNDIGRELKVGAVLEGSVRKDGNRIRVTAQAVNVEDGFRFWSRTYDRNLDDIFAVQREIAMAVVQAIDDKLLAGKEPIVERGPENPDAYTQYLIGRQQFFRLTTDGFRRAADAFAKALTIDPRYAPAWAELAITTYLLAEEAGNDDEIQTRRRRALEQAERAVALSPNLVAARVARGLLRARVATDWLGAEADLEQAVATRGSDAESHRAFSVVLMGLGRLQEAIAEARKAIDLDPLGPAWVNLGALLRASGSLEDSEAAYRRHLRLQPDSEPGLIGLGRTLLLEGKPDEALAAFKRCPADVGAWGKAMAEHLRGNASAEREALETLLSKYAGAQAFYIAEAYAVRGEKDAAFEWLNRCIDRQDGEAVTFLKTDPFLRNLRGDPRYAALLRRIHLEPAPG